jgi:hypothetical protein
MACVGNPNSGSKCAGDSSGENDGEYGKETKFESICGDCVYGEWMGESI